ncbi:hypothetical protein A2881_00990 [Candidatus Peribacteria bacterium RIFCSPHIGHO2_01_FULL_55_13]|nr:MAG: hypothetical protein A2881_00990 [Candidatus Peribacteria bacterium RIFCSPHIGHO2_01_FULL_55_13]
MSLPNFSQTPIRAIVARFSSDVAQKTIREVLLKRPFDFCAVLSSDTVERLENVPEERQEWFSSSQVRGCDYAGVDWSRVTPLDEELIERMRGCETVFMDMVMRLEWKRSIPYAVRKQWYLRHLQFWNDYLIRQRINLYISAWIPHEIPDIVIYHLCKLRRIPVVYFHTTTMRDVSFAEYAIEDPAPKIPQRYEALLREYAGVKDWKEIPLSASFNKRFASLTTPAVQKPPIESYKRLTYWGRIRRMLTAQPLLFLQFLVAYCTPTGLRRALKTCERWMAVRRTNAYYDAHAINPDFTRPFVYLPLHYQPEASTVPMGGTYANQLLVADLLNAHLPEDVLIYVKEHPRAGGWLTRSPGYYAQLLAMKKVRLIARHVDTFLLREHCKAVATVTGSAGFEAIFRGKPVLLFGYRFYQYARGVFRVRTAEDCAKAAREIFMHHATPSLVESRLFLRAIEETCIHAVLDPWKLKVTHLSEEEHVRKCTDAILQELDAMNIK